MDTTNRGNSPLTSGMSAHSDGTLNKASSGVHADGNSIDRVAEMAHQAVDKAAGAAAPAADWLAKQGASVNAAQKKLMTDACGYVSANPVKSVAIAVVTGFVLSRIISR